MKKLVLILDSLDRMYPENNEIIGGANKVGRFLIDYFSSLKDVPDGLFTFGSIPIMAC